MHRKRRLANREPRWYGSAPPGTAKKPFAAARFVIDEVKKRVPIWKREHYPEGPAEWINAAPPEDA